MEKVNLNQKFKLFSELWTPKIVGELNGQYVKLAKAQGEFVWHKHDHEDEFFLVIKGPFTVKLRERNIRLDEGEFCIVPKGIEHKPVAEEEAHILVFEPKSTKHTGDVKSDLTVEKLEWI
ncbi:MAG: cupin domain-containing protein [Candidatus Aminicenantes bacterium]|nr:cupin domain-containing protein [Candidatus Aminicenantes bacterium]MDH5706444.1 cupin domain-containing protein [Candidatus Aminicenantes bacterium]